MMTKLKQRSWISLILALPLSWAFVASAVESPHVDEDFVNFRIADNPLDRIPPYRERRESTGTLFSVGVSQFVPYNYQPQYRTEDYEAVYESSDLLYELSLLYKYNFFLGSLSMGVAVGYMTALSADVDVYGDTEVSFMPIRLETVFALDNLFPNPVFVPYGTGGIYTMYHKEVQASTSFSGTTEAALFFGAGVLVQLDWLLPEEALHAYRENGQENTFMYLEGKKYLASAQVPNDQDFETDFLFAGGMKLEF